MLIQSFHNKTIAIVGYHALSAKILIKKLLPMVSTPIIAVTLDTNHVKRDYFLIHSYFSKEQQKMLKQKLVFINLSKLKQAVQQTPSKQIDMLFSLFQPVDFSNQDKVIRNHLLTTGMVTQTLSRINIERCMLLSSVYLKDAGYVGEDDQLDEPTIPIRFHSIEEAKMYMKDNFDSVIEGWKWSINYIQESYLSVSQKIVIVRVPALGPTLLNHEGYSGELTSLSYLICQVGMGNITSLDGLKNNKIDIVPTDFAAHLLLVLAGKQQNSKAEVVNLSTTTRNYITLQQFIEISREAWREYGEKPAKVKIVQSQWGQKLKHKTEKLPSEVKKRLGGMLDIVSWKIQGQRQSLQKDQKISIINKYKYFLCKQWLCQSIKTIDLYNQLCPQDQNNFNFNVNSINWKIYVKLCVYSMKKYILNHNVQQFKPESMDLLGTTKTESYFSDIMWAMKQGKEAAGQTRKDAVQFVLNSKAVKDAIKAIVQDNMMKLQNPPTSYEKAEDELKKVAEQICTQMFSDYSMKSIRVFGWFLHKLFSSIYQKVVVDKSDIAKIQNHKDSDGPLIIIPTHRSYIDFLIISYVFFGYGIKVPHIAAAEDFLGMAMVHILLRRSGAFFIKRNQKKYKQLYKAILNQYLSKLMIGNHYIEFFIEGTRSRAGKILTPKFGILSVITQNVLEGRVPDAFILPVTINYQKVLEGSSFTYQMMGQSKVKESLSRVLKSVDVLKQNYGRIHLQFCDMISVKKYMSNSQGTYQDKIQSFGYTIIRNLQSKLVISGPAIIASAVLMNRKGISDDALQQKTTWLSKEISSRGIKITRSQPDSSISVNSTLGLLEGILNKSKKDMFEVEVNFDQNSFVKMFTLTYYRNTLTHIFFEEAVIATAFASFQYKNITVVGVPKDELWKRTIFLWNLLEKQFVLSTSLRDRARFEERISFMTVKNVFKIENEVLKAINPATSNYYSFYWSLTWPIVQSYWITCLYLFKLQKNQAAIPLSKLLTQIQWFAQSLINDHICTFLEAISSDTIKNAVNTFLKIKFITSVKQERNGQTVQAIKLAVSEQELRKMLEEIGLYLKTTYAKSLKGIFQGKNTSVNLDFPFLSKL